MPEFFSPEHVLPNHMELVVVALKGEDDKPQKGLFKMAFYKDTFVDPFCREFSPHDIYAWRSTGRYRDPYKEAKTILNKIIGGNYNRQK